MKSLKESLLNNIEDTLNDGTAEVLAVTNQFKKVKLSEIKIKRRSEPDGSRYVEGMTKEIYKGVREMINSINPSDKNAKNATWIRFALDLTGWPDWSKGSGKTTNWNASMIMVLGWDDREPLKMYNIGNYINQRNNYMYFSTDLQQIKKEFVNLIKKLSPDDLINIIKNENDKYGVDDWRDSIKKYLWTE